jgi:hypothetical protein
MLGRPPNFKKIQEHPKIPTQKCTKKLSFANIPFTLFLDFGAEI